MSITKASLVSTCRAIATQPFAVYECGEKLVKRFDSEAIALIFARRRERETGFSCTVIEADAKQFLLDVLDGVPNPDGWVRTVGRDPAEVVAK